MACVHTQLETGAILSQASSIRARHHACSLQFMPRHRWRSYIKVVPMPPAHDDDPTMDRKLWHKDAIMSDKRCCMGSAFRKRIESNVPAWDMPNCPPMLCCPGVAHGDKLLATENHWSFIEIATYCDCLRSVLQGTDREVVSRASRLCRGHGPQRQAFFVRQLDGTNREPNCCSCNNMICDGTEISMLILALRACCNSETQCTVIWKAAAESL